jgi:tetratricopeptide (TPR) repeat protein
VLHANLGLQQAAAGSFDDAIARFRLALDLHRAVGNEEGLAVTYGQLGKTFLLAGRSIEAERCLNNASEHFIKLGDEPGEAGALRLLADLYEQRGDVGSAVRCIEHVVQIARRYTLPQRPTDEARLLRLQNAASHGAARKEPA